jgi:hypothetical protein
MREVREEFDRYRDQSGGRLNSKWLECAKSKLRESGKRVRTEGGTVRIE